MKNWKSTLAGCAAMALALGGVTTASLAPARADVKTGVDAWAQGDYARAVAAWRPLAEAGDPDAEFNLGQAYKLGRGVPADTAAALDWFRKAAIQGHNRAEDNYALLLFQQGRRQEAMPYLGRAADRGEPRAQYLVGTALFNGDYLAKDWVRAYALMTRSAASGVPQATATLAQMDRFIPEAQRKQGLALASRMGAGTASSQPSGIPLAEQSLAAAQPRPAPRPAPVPARAPAAPKPAPAKPAPEKPARPAVTPPPATKPAAKPVPTGRWRIQLGAFSQKSRAEQQWKTLSHSVKGLSAHRPAYEQAGAMTRLLAGQLPDRAAAEKLCASVRATGAGCFVKAP